MRTAETEYEVELNREITHFIKNSLKGSFDLEIHAPITYKNFFNNKMLVISSISAGITYSLFSLIQQITPLSENEWARLLDISTKSLHRYKSLEVYHFKPIHSEKIIEIAEVTKEGLEVFGSMEKLNLWFNTPNFALGNLKPLELLKDSYGKELVIGELTRINHGILV